MAGGRDAGMCRFVGFVLRHSGDMGLRAGGLLGRILEQLVY